MLTLDYARMTPHAIENRVREAATEAMSPVRVAFYAYREKIEGQIAAEVAQAVMDTMDKKVKAALALPLFSTRRLDALTDLSTGLHGLATRIKERELAGYDYNAMSRSLARKWDRTPALAVIKKAIDQLVSQGARPGSSAIGRLNGLAYQIPDMDAQTIEDDMQRSIRFTVEQTIRRPLASLADKIAYAKSEAEEALIDD